MADKNEEKAPEVTVEEEVPVSEVEVPEAPAAADAEEAREPTATVVQGEVPHAVVQPREPDADVAQVHEVVVQTDEVITDPSDPQAVQIPEAGRGDSSLPIHALANPVPEAVFADEASKADKPDAADKARDERYRTGS